MKQLELFNLTNLHNSSDVSTENLTHWEHENREDIPRNHKDGLKQKSSHQDSTLFDNPHDITELAVSEYKPGGSAGKTQKYYRFSYKKNGKVRHTHIKGGNITNSKAIERKEQVEHWILLHIPPGRNRQTDKSMVIFHQQLATIAYYKSITIKRSLTASCKGLTLLNSFKNVDD